MTAQEAHRLLDAARAGLPVSDLDVTYALWLTGDLSAREVDEFDEEHQCQVA